MNTVYPSQSKFAKMTMGRDALKQLDVKAQR